MTTSVWMGNVRRPFQHNVSKGSWIPLAMNVWSKSLFTLWEKRAQRPQKNWSVQAHLVPESLSKRDGNLNITDLIPPWHTTVISLCFLPQKANSINSIKSVRRIDYKHRVYFNEGGAVPGWNPAFWGDKKSWSLGLIPFSNLCRSISLPREDNRTNFTGKRRSLGRYWFDCESRRRNQTLVQRGLPD